MFQLNVPIDCSVLPVLDTEDAQNGDFISTPQVGFFLSGSPFSCSKK